jgi:hypothetical protein
MPIFDIGEGVEQVRHIFVRYANAAIHHRDAQLFFPLGVSGDHFDNAPAQSKLNSIAEVVSEDLLHALLVALEELGDVAAELDSHFYVFGSSLGIENVHDLHQSALDMEVLFALSECAQLDPR